MAARMAATLATQAITANTDTPTLIPAKVLRPEILTGKGSNGSINNFPGKTTGFVNARTLSMKT